MQLASLYQQVSRSLDDLRADSEDLQREMERREEAFLHAERQLFNARDRMRDHDRATNQKQTEWRRVRDALAQLDQKLQSTSAHAIPKP